MNAAVSEYMSELGRRGGAKGGPARMAGMSPAEKRKHQSHASKARWEKERSENTLTATHKVVREMLHEAVRTGKTYWLFMLSDGRSAAFFEAESKEGRDMMARSEETCVGTFDSSSSTTEVYNSIMEL